MIYVGEWDGQWAASFFGDKARWRYMFHRPVGSQLELRSAQNHTDPYRAKYHHIILPPTNRFQRYFPCLSPSISPVIEVSSVRDGQDEAANLHGCAGSERDLRSEVAPDGKWWTGNDQEAAAKKCVFWWFPTCQVRVVRFYVNSRASSFSSFSFSASPPPPRTSTTTSHAQCSLPDLNHDQPRPVFAAGPQPRLATPSVRCRTSTTTSHAQRSLPDLNHDHPRPVFAAGPQPRPSTPSVRCRTSTTTIHAQCSLPDLNRQKICQIECQIECQKIWQTECRIECQIECQEIWQIECQKICQIECQIKCQIECQKICQIECQKICQIEYQRICQIECQKIWQTECQKICQIKRQKIYMPDKTSEDMPDGMPDRLSDGRNWMSWWGSLEVK